MRIVPRVQPTAARSIRALEYYWADNLGDQESCLMKVINGLDDATLRKIWNMGPPLNPSELVEYMTHWKASPRNGEVKVIGSK